MNHPKFKGWGDFFQATGPVGRIYLLGLHDGGRVLRPWINNHGWLTPFFREQLCLVVTMTNRCVG